MENIILYIQTWVRSLRAREQGDDVTEDALLEQLDKIWLEMTSAQITTINALSKALVNQQMTLDDLDALTQGGLPSTYFTSTSLSAEGIGMYYLQDFLADPSETTHDRAAGYRTATE